MKNLHGLYWRIWCLGIWFLAGLCVCGCTGTWTRQPGHTGLRSSLSGAVRYGPISGFLQTPLGGSPGTTSSRRPKFKELGIDTVTSADTSLTLGWGNHALIGGGVLSRLSGDSVLDRPLISRGTSFLAGTSVSSHVQLDRYRAAYQYCFLFAQDKGATVELTPEVGVVLFNFDYTLAASGSLSTGRAFVQAAPELGLDSVWRLGRPFSVSAVIHGVVPEASRLSGLSAQLTGNYRFWGQADRSGSAILGVGYDLIDFEDSQKVPNHIRAEMGPLVVAGLQVRF